MKNTIRIKSLFARALEIAGVISWKLRRYNQDEVAVLMYHRVLPKKEVDAFVQAGMFVEPATLEAHLSFLLQHFDIVPLSNLAPRDLSKDNRSGGKPLCAITFDDGWYDFYKYAYPILVAKGVPATVFLPTDFIGTERWFWTDKLGFLLGGLDQTRGVAERASTNKDPLLLELLQVVGSREEKLERMIALLKGYEPERIESVIAQLAVALRVDASPPGRAFVTWEEVREMFSSGLITFGSHTASHPLLTNVSLETAGRELKDSKEVLLAQAVVDPGCISFSYPNGSYSAQLSRMAQDAGYQLAVITERGWHRLDANPYTIQRIAIHQDMSASNALFGARIANLI